MSRPVAQKSKKIPKSTKFEDALGELEAIVESLETGEQSLDASLEQFERGVSLSRFCQQSLSEAEQKVRILMNDSADADADEDSLDDFDTDTQH
ncbi:exodeoxyribonuclease VII small subunit [Granulosicoccus sp. 3-233]|uniref:exodeoxyribonuclease VII small subunit n=1 Tax=Granulosicoccus sp. 3-233 TaxID=3417969 RepID=UPI003D32EBE3